MHQVATTNNVRDRFSQKIRLLQLIMYDKDRFNKPIKLLAAVVTSASNQFMWLRSDGNRIVESKKTISLSSSWESSSPFSSAIFRGFFSGNFFVFSHFIVHWPKYCEKSSDFFVVSSCNLTSTVLHSTAHAKM